VAPEELLPTCKAMAAEMASCVPAVLRGYKTLIDTGYGMPLPDALRYEKAAAIQSAKEISAATIAARREGVFARGRDQTQK
jgi:enoyl-CoA hydratase